MTATTAFLVDVLLAAVVCTGIVAYVKNHLRSLLIELCGTPERAGFWLAFCNVALVVVPLIFVLGYQPQIGAGKSIVFEIAGQLKYALIGFVVTLSILALALLRYIPRDSSKPATERRDEVMS